MRSPFAPLPLALFLGILASLVLVLQLELFSFAFERLGLSPGSALLLLIACLAGSAINLPLGTVKCQPPSDTVLRDLPGRLLRQPAGGFTGRTTVAVNVGGCLLPVAFCAYLLGSHALAAGDAVVAVTAVSAVSHIASRPVPGLGIAMPILIAPVTAALVAVILSPTQSAALAYVGGTLGVLIGADLLRLKDLGRMGTPVASIGGAGTFDGIFLTGVVAVLLA